MAGFGDFLLGFGSSYAEDLQKDRDRQRDAEDNELKTRGAILQTMIKNMENNPANGPLVQKAWQDYIAAAQAIGKNRPRKKGMAGFRGETEVPGSQFIDLLNAGQVPSFGKVGLDMKPLSIGNGQPALESTNGMPMPQQNAPTTGGGGDNPYQMPPVPDLPDTEPTSGSPRVQPFGQQGPAPMAAAGPSGPPPQPQPYVPQPPGTGRMNQAVNQTAMAANVDPFPQASYSPGMMLGPEDQAKLEGITDYTRARLKQRALVANLQEVGASRDQIVDALIPGSQHSTSPFTQYQTYMAPDGHMFDGMRDKNTGAVHMAGNPGMVIDGAIPYGYKSTTMTDAQGRIVNVYRPNQPMTVTGQPGAVVESTGVSGPPRALPMRPVVGPDGKTYWTESTVTNPAALGGQAPQPASTDPNAIKANAEATYKQRMADIEARQARMPGEQGYLSPQAADKLKRIAQEEYDARIRYERESAGGSIPSPSEADTMHGPAWYTTKKLPPLVAGKGPAWNPQALQRMRQYLEEKGRERGQTTAVSDEIVKKAMQNETLRIDAGLVQ